MPAGSRLQIPPAFFSVFNPLDLGFPNKSLLERICVPHVFQFEHTSICYTKALQLFDGGHSDQCEMIPHYRFLFFVFFFFWRGGVVCIFLTTNDVEHLLCVY